MKIEKVAWDGFDIQDANGEPYTVDREELMCILTDCLNKSSFMAKRILFILDETDSWEEA